MFTCRPVNKAVSSGGDERLQTTVGGHKGSGCPDHPVYSRTGEEEGTRPSQAADQGGCEASLILSGLILVTFSVCWFDAGQIQ